MSRNGSQPSRLSLPSSVRSYVSTWAVDGHPDEVCGLLIGKREAASFEVVRATLSRNLETDRTKDRFILSPDDWVAAENQARNDGLDVIGVWHTHPDHPAEPSSTDLAAAWEEYAYVILSVKSDGVVDLRSWQLQRESFAEQVIEESKSWSKS